MNYSDADFVNGLMARDERILRQYFIRYFPGIRHHVLSNQGNEEDARDLFQDVLLVFFQKVQQKDFQLTCALGTYLYSISRILWLKELSKRKRMIRQTVDFEDYTNVDDDIEYISEKNERLLVFRKCFENLTENCKKVLQLFADGLSISEITESLGYKSVQHTKNRRYRCKLSLMNSIKAAYDYHNAGYGNNTPD